MPPKRESPEEKYARATRVANLAVCKADFIRCCMAMKDKPDVITSVKRHLVSIGAWDGSMPERRAKDEDTAEQNPDDENRDAGGPLSANLDIEMHRNFATWGQIPPSHLMTVLQLIEPVALNAKVLHIYCKGAQRVVPKEVCLQFLEFTCDVDPSSTIDGERTLASMVELCTSLNNSNGRRAQMFEHPVSWAKKGFYTLAKNDELKYVLSKIGGISRLIPPKMLSLIEDPALLYVDQNHSERRSSLRHHKDKLFNVSCYQLICDAENVVFKSFAGSGFDEAVKEPNTEEPGADDCAMAAPVVPYVDAAFEDAFINALMQTNENATPPEEKVKLESTPTKSPSVKLTTKTKMPNDAGYRPSPPPKKVKT
jgi:hypothetical protein